ncbi:MAG: hypothetical protein WC464_09230 [Bdellovibrionales bacterium]
MEDRGEKIIFLARELLESDALLPHTYEPPVTKKTMTVTMTFRTLCFTTLLAAASGNMISTFVHEHSRPLNRYEKTELQALIFYTSRIKTLDEEVLRREVEEKIGVSSFDDMTAKDFPAARRFLQEKAQ